ncbi:polysaccharide lyase family 7 protein [Reinekea thalattae]|uniref:F5/8 type C domain-containing protein n=1 Tax=Reinekea thalattae TaxID=2593301 RepID=A0A5C8ZB45_9GAMM|nr:polysaccharide lyase family 7 protein [Reinekea thalattae]TXR54408.1 hypothetical protein FME95_07680 [Reinekea thalattae]
MKKNWLLCSALLAAAGAHAATLNIDNASDWGGSHSSYPASNAIDGSSAWETRWAAANGASENLVLDLASDQSVNEVSIAWGRGDSRTYNFEIRVLSENGDSSDWTKVYYGSSSLVSSNGDFESYSFDSVSARYVRIKTFSNSTGSDWTDINEVTISGGSSSGGGSNGGDYGLSTDVAPAGNFDLWDWYLSVPTDTNGDGKADSIKEDQLNDENYESEYFYTDEDSGAMVFECTVGGYKTSSGTKYTRTELREMLRRGDTSIDTSYDYEDDPDGNGRLNNWAFSTINSSDYDEFGGIDGTLDVTLAVNKVTTTGSLDPNPSDEDDLENYKKVGRIVIGQIHASGNEPIRLYYHKYPYNTYGSIYFAHEPSVEAKEDGEKEKWYGLLGNMIDNSDNSYVDVEDMANLTDPSDGIKLNETFSYSIDVDGDYLSVTISQDGQELAYKQISMSSSGYDDSNNYMFFKAGIYLNDDVSDSDDSAKLSIYELSNSHDGYNY